MALVDSGFTRAASSTRGSARKQILISIGFLGRHRKEQRVLPALGVVHVSSSHQLAADTGSRITAAFALLIHEEIVMGTPVDGKPSLFCKSASLCR